MTSTIRLLLDQGLPRSAAERLRAAGVDATHVAELGMWAALDSEIRERAQQAGQVIVTLDPDSCVAGDCRRERALRVEVAG